MSAQTPFLVFSGTNSRYLAEKICNSLGCPLGQMNIQHFADGEFSVSYEESIRGRDVFLVQSTFPNSDNLMELLLMIDAAKRASAHSIIAVVPYFGCKPIWAGEPYFVGYGFKELFSSYTGIMPGVRKAANQTSPFGKFCVELLKTTLAPTFNQSKAL